MKATSVNFTTTDPNQHVLTIIHDDGIDIVYLSVNQIMILLQQMLACVWSHYRQVPRD